MTTTTWTHDPDRADAADPDLHDPDPARPCFGCWCYACGGRTDRPRVERADDRHPGEPSHRWCFEG